MEESDRLAVESADGKKLLDHSSRVEEAVKEGKVRLIPVQEG